jgi:hypothetical protein
MILIGGNEIAMADELSSLTPAVGSRREARPYKLRKMQSL